MRTAFVNTLMNLMKKNDNIYLLTGDLGFSVFDKLKEQFPKNFLNVGISEANMIGIAAGLALCNKQVFVYSIIPFVTYRVLEQIRNDLCYQKLPVKIIGVGSGLSYGAAGVTHHSIEDIAIMSSLPEMTVLAPGDPVEVKLAVEQSINLEGPCYIRLGKNGEPVIHNEKNINFKIGKGIKLKEGNDISVFVTGNMLETAVEVSKILENNNLSVEIISMHTIKPLDEDIIVESAKNKKLIVSIEEHIETGGLGSKIADVLLKNTIYKRFMKFALPDKFIHEVGSQKYLRQLYFLTPDKIASKILCEIDKGDESDKYSTKYI
ncbi:transketolase [Caldanaerobius fijiensis DSM 17918]|uniref:Transketolase n=1 Tax=Caldanaerobius fijiensis DSM 17918 TaxID=1121256 RepID=A0A1M5DZF3_9THEO|nr:transketolase C-terminal domain-containing protein [Caldanaerobius fijiensis]SHF72325.1 transketolase [Caldanaerobius fijiensis DSM 17918]